MAKRKGMIRTCSNGHKYVKSSDCPTCPKCEALRLKDSHFIPSLSAPAKRALENAGITSLAKLAGWREADVLKLHGMGPASAPRMRSALKVAGLKFRS